MTTAPARRGRPIIKSTAPKASVAPAAVDDSPIFEMPPLRQEMRPPLREADDPRARAAKRAEELRAGGALDIAAEDRFYVDRDAIPDGWDYQWKRKSILGKEDPAYDVQLARSGWEPVPASRHPEHMPIGTKSRTIERDGMILMERPKEITDEARAMELQAARTQIRSKEGPPTSAPNGQFERNYNDIKKTYEHIPIAD